MKTVEPEMRVSALRAVVRDAAPCGVCPAPEVLDLLSAISEAMAVPLPAPGAGNEHAYQSLMERRMTFVRCALEAMLAPGAIRSQGRVLSREDASWLRRHIAISPVTYRAYEPEPAPIGA